MKKSTKMFVWTLALTVLLACLQPVQTAKADDYPTVWEGIDYSAVYSYPYYAANNPDVVAYYGDDPWGVLSHFVEWGMSEGRRAKAEFDVVSYRNAYPDLRAAFGNNWTAYYYHYIQYGRYEGRVATGVPTPQGGAAPAPSVPSQNQDSAPQTETPSSDQTSDVSGSEAASAPVPAPAPAAPKATTVYEGVDYSAVYDYDYYTSRYGDLTQVLGNDPEAILRHFVEWGMAECRQASENFDPVSYYNAYRDLRVAFGNDWESYYRHYMDWGKAEGRRATGVNTLTGFLSSYDGVDYHLIYDYNYYVANNPDVVRAVGRNDEAVLKHFVEWGMAEGRRGNASFNVREYREVNPDVAKALGMNWEAIYYHYLEYGYAEGRPTSWDQVKKEEETISGFDGQRPYADRYIQAACYWEGRDGYSIDKIVIHHWGEDGQQQSNVVNWFVNPDSQASAHYVVSDGLVTQMVQESDTAWHAANRIANKQSIGIECHPEKTPGDVDTVVNLIANIWHSYGKVLPLTKHSDYVATDCPGRWADLKELTEKAKKIYLVLEAE